MTAGDLAPFDRLAGRIGFFGGSFDPPHQGHLEVARTARVRARLDHVVFVPAQQSPHKPAGTSASGAHRLAMVRAAVAEDPGFLVSELELERPGPSYTIDTLLRVCRELPERSSLVLVLGSDSLRAFPRWARVHEILSLVELAVVERAEFSRTDVATLGPELSATELARIERGFLEREPVRVSSTEVREALDRGEIPREALPDPVVRYILEHHLYAVASP